MLPKSKNSIKKNILSKISIAFLIAWTFFLSYMFLSLKNELLTKYEKQGALYKERLVQLIDSNSESLAVISKNISRITFSDANTINNNDANSLSEKLNISWEIFKRQKSFLSLKHYGNNAKLLNIWGQGANNLMSTERLKKSFEARKGHASISCSKSCYLNMSHTLHPSSFREGIIEVSIPLFGVLDRFKSLVQPNVVVMKELASGSTQETRSLQLLGRFYKKMTATSVLVLDEINLDILHQGEKNKSYIIKNNNKIYFLYAAFMEKYPKIIFIFYEDISDFANFQKNHFFRISIFSLCIALFILTILYFSLNHVISHLQKIIKILPIIGSGNFTLAREQIAAINPSYKNDELGLLYSSTKSLNEKLKDLHESLRLKNITLQKIADYDAMTGIFNRRKFMEALKKSYKEDKNFYLVNIDLDHFKIINDTMGHAEGDKTLIEIAKTLSSSVSKNDVVGRVGGDEFNIILKNNNINIVKKSLDEIISKTKKIKLSKGSVFYSKITLSIGVAYYDSNNTTIDDITAFADIAMYENKRYKENAYHFYTGRELILVEEKKTISSMDIILVAIENDLIKPFYQKILSKNNEIYSYEALIRIWDEKKQLYYTPDFFIEQAEKSHAIIQIDKIMIKKILNETHTIRPQPRLMINLSNITIASQNIEKYLIDLICLYGYTPSLITIEITESTEIKNFKEIELLIKRLKNIGIKFALDDFGSGYSSFYYISRLPIDYIKIDKDIITSLLIENSDSINSHIFEAITSVAKKSNMKIIAEGIESVELFNIVNQFDVDLFQGYLFDRPSPVLSTSNQRKPVNISIANSSTN